MLSRCSKTGVCPNLNTWVIVSDIPANFLPKLTSEELKQLDWEKR